MSPDPPERDASTTPEPLAREPAPPESSAPEPDEADDIEFEAINLDDDPLDPQEALAAMAADAIPTRPPDEPVTIDLDADADEPIDLTLLEGREAAPAGDPEPAEEEPDRVSLDVAAVDVAEVLDPTATDRPVVEVLDLDSAVPGAEALSAEERARLLAEAAAYAEILEQHYRQPMLREQPVGRWKAPLGFVLMVIAALLAAFPPAWLAPAGPPPITAGERIRGVHATLAVQAEQIRVFQARHGRLPRTLEELPVRLPGLRYVRSNNRVYQLQASLPDGDVVTYDAAHPLPEVERLRRELFHGGGS